ncbi:TetR/AcrR family transcriptional regulator [Streptomyces sp. SLBN-31]|uniref:TetR/AcrR family transcriptional regulator n=1 Tax=Streptomyces sp. SLBN-31 TaxID=2768444 RepID=UPI0011537CF8|nr:TetR/AcrR family transcriptional regulator [Streptomyces sp. SLBN-31]TQJ92468.1 TetR family transcriptional regulator [Streptomyces sp. SLBN-31]
MVTRVRKTKSEERILNAAAELFHANGLRGVGVDQVIAAAGIAKATLYAHFRTKDELVAAYLRRTDDSWMAQMQDAAARSGDDPREQLVALFDALTDAFDRHGFFGCPFVSAAVEADLDSEARAITVQHTQRRQAWLTELCEQAGADVPGALARHIGLLIDGALASGRLLQDPVVVEEAKSAARLLVYARS